MSSSVISPVRTVQGKLVDGKIKSLLMNLTSKTEYNLIFAHNLEHDLRIVSRQGMKKKNSIKLFKLHLILFSFGSTNITSPIS